MSLPQPGSSDWSALHVGGATSDPVILHLDE